MRVWKIGKMVKLQGRETMRLLETLGVNTRSPSSETNLPPIFIESLVASFGRGTAAHDDESADEQQDS